MFFGMSDLNTSGNRILITVKVNSKIVNYSSCQPVRIINVWEDHIFRMDKLELEPVGLGKLTPQSQTALAQKSTLGRYNGC